jgi:hypothetical protein
MADKVKEKKEVKTLELEVNAFISSQPYWAQHICSQILENKEIDDVVINTAFSYLLEDLGLKEETDKTKIQFSFNENSSDDFKEDILFKSLKKVEGVNALSENQIIELTPNLTIVYGANGSGKSGYVRLFKNAFYSKDKKDILPNINITTDHKAISAIFSFTTDGNYLELNFPDDSKNGIFSQFAVFDGDVGKKHLSSRNDFRFRPAGLNLFNGFNTSLEKINEKLDNEISKKNIVNPFLGEDIFPGDSPIKDFLVSLSSESDLTKLNEYIPFSEDDKRKKIEFEKQYDDLKIKLAQKEKALKDLYNIKKLLNAKKASLTNLNKWFAINQLKAINTLISDCKTKIDLVQKEGIEKFKTEKISNIGSIEWKNFIVAAEKFANIQSESSYPNEGDHCLFCLQPLQTSTSIELIHNYWAYIKSVAEQEAKTAKENIGKQIKGYSELNLLQLPESDSLTIWLKENYKSFYEYYIGKLEEQNKLLQIIINNLNALELIPNNEIQIDLKSMDTFLIELDKEIKIFEDDEENKILSGLLSNKTYLVHKEKLGIRFDDIRKLHENMIWVEKANSFKKQGFKTLSTRTEKRLSIEYFNQDYITAFNNECINLNGNFGIEIDAKSSDAQSNRQLFLKGNDPSIVLSEGEQKVIALADFIAETYITGINKGVIFDDPVTSLDEKRKINIADRIVSLAENKQVLVFTHDLAFVSSLINYASDKKLQHECHWIENRNGEPGHIWLRNSPSYERLYRNAEPAKEYYGLANKDDCSPEEREIYLKSGFTALRTCYEVLVINELFCNVVQRYNERVSVDALKSVKFTEEVKDELLTGFGQCCRFMEGHSHSDKYSYVKPEPKNLNEEIQRYEAIRKKIKDSKK